MDVMGIRLGSDTVEILHQEVPLCGWRVSTGTSGEWWWGVVVGMVGTTFSAAPSVCIASGAPGAVASPSSPISACVPAAGAEPWDLLPCLSREAPSLILPTLSPHPQGPCLSPPSGSLQCSRLTQQHPPFLAKCYLNSEFCPLANCHLIFSSSWLKAKEYSFQIKMVKTSFSPLPRFLCKCSAACC